MNPASHEGRGVKRLPCCLAVTTRKKSAPLGEITDLSLDGLFIACSEPLPLGATVPLVFPVGGSGRKLLDIHAEAEVVRVSPKGMGLRFLRISAADSRRLRRFVVELLDAVGARENADKLLDVDARVSKPIGDADEIARRLRAATGVISLLPAARSERLSATMRDVGTDGIRLETAQPGCLKRDEAVLGIYVHDFVSYCFRSTVLAANDTDVLLAPPTELVYSERRSKQRHSFTENGTLTLAAPQMPSGSNSYSIFETSTNGFSFKARPEQANFWVGTVLPPLVITQEGQQRAIENAVVRHLTPMVEDDGEAWVRIGVSIAAPRQVLKETSVILPKTDGPNGIVEKVSAVGRDVKTALSYFYYTRAAAHSAQQTRGHHVVQYKNAANQPLVGLLDTSFSLENGRVRCPLVIVVPGFGGRKEVMSSLANVLVDNWRRNMRDLAVFRFDGTNNLGESHKDPGCEGEGRHTLRFTISGAIRDLLATLEWAKRNKYVDPTSVIFFSASIGAISARKVLTMTEAALVSHWISFMGAADVANTGMRGAGNIDFIGNHERGLKTGIISLNGCMSDADHFAQDAVAIGAASLDDALQDMRSIRADVTWFIGMHDAFVDPKRVRDIMSVKSPGERQVVEVNAGHVPRHGEEALAEFAVMVQHLWKALYGKHLTATIPSRGWLGACEQREWKRVRKGVVGSAQDWWKDYLVGDNGIGFDAWALTPEYQQLVRDQTRAVMAPGVEKVLDLGAGTGNMTQALAAAGVPMITAVDLVPEALARIKAKTAPAEVTTIATTADGGPKVALRRWLQGDLDSVEALGRRLHPSLQDALTEIAGRYNAELHSAMRGSLIDLKPCLRRAGLSEDVRPALEEVRRLSRMLRGLPTTQVTTALTKQLEETLQAAAGLPFSDASFDAVVCSLVLSYLEHPDDALFEMRRVLRPGARLMVSSMLPDMDSSKLFVNAVDTVERMQEKDVPSGWTKAGLLDALRAFANRSSRLLHLEEEGAFKFFSADEMVNMLMLAGFENVQFTMSCGDPPLAVIATGIKARN